MTNEESNRDRELLKKNEVDSAENSNNTTLVGYNTEAEVIGILFKGNEEVAKFIANQIPIDEFIIGRHIQLAEIVYSALENGEEIITSALIDKIKEEELQLYVRELVFDKYAISKNWDDIRPGEDSEISLQKTAKDTVIKFKVEKINYLIQNNFKKAEAASTEEEKFELAKLNSVLEKEKILLNKNQAEIES